MDVALPVALFILLAMIGFFALSLAKAWKLAHMKMHARLDLYPVPKEGAGRASYGGSYLEEPEWWRKPRHLDHANETFEILKEMVFIKKLFVNQRSLWWASYAMHLGIYAMLCWSVLLLVNVFWANAVFMALTQAVGVVGFTLASLGCVLLLVRRAVDRVLRNYTTPLEYFNIVLLLAVLLTGAASWLLFASPFQVASQVLLLDPAGLPPLVMVHLVLLGCMFLYIPLSKMSHYVAKFFTYHRVLWDNDPNLPGSDVERKFEQNAAHPAKSHWSAAQAKSATTESAKG